MKEWTKGVFFGVVITLELLAIDKLVKGYKTKLDDLEEKIKKLSENEPEAEKDE